jgi:hypothetical protein
MFVISLQQREEAGKARARQKQEARKDLNTKLSHAEEPIHPSAIAALAAASANKQSRNGVASPGVAAMAAAAAAKKQMNGNVKPPVSTEKLFGRPPLVTSVAAAAAAKPQKDGTVSPSTMAPCISKTENVPKGSPTDNVVEPKQESTLTIRERARALNENEKEFAGTLLKNDVNKAAKLAFAEEKKDSAQEAKESQEVFLSMVQSKAVAVRNKDSFCNETPKLRLPNSVTTEKRRADIARRQALQSSDLILNPKIESETNVASNDSLHIERGVYFAGPQECALASTGNAGTITKGHGTSSGASLHETKDQCTASNIYNLPTKKKNRDSAWLVEVKSAISEAKSLQKNDCCEGIELSCNQQTSS